MNKSEPIEILRRAHNFLSFGTRECVLESTPDRVFGYCEIVKLASASTNEELIANGLTNEVIEKFALQNKQTLYRDLRAKEFRARTGFQATREELLRERRREYKWLLNNCSQKIYDILAAKTAREGTQFFSGYNDEAQEAFKQLIELLNKAIQNGVVHTHKDHGKLYLKL